MLRKLFLASVLAGLSSSIVTAQTDVKSARRNVIVLVADGGGYNSYIAGSMYQGKWDDARSRMMQVYNSPQWTQLAVQTYPLNTSKKPLGTNQQDPALVYDPAKAWDHATGYDWLKGKYTDSAASATALSTGIKTFNNAINWSDHGQPITPTMSELAHSLGLACGVVTTVQWSHATPAGFSNAHVPERDQYQDIATQMLNGGVLDVIMGAGNPDFDNNGKPWQPRKRSPKPSGAAKGVTGEVADKQEYRYVGGKDAWTAIEAARKRPDGLYRGYRPVSTKAEFEALCSGKTPPKILGTAQVATTLQQARAKSDAKDPGEDTPPNPNVPTLATMARGALNVLGQNPKGFFLMIEGGAVDWANHNNNGCRMVQEQADFNLAVEAVVQWVEINSSWEQTLVVITADHETGLLWGPDSDKQPFQPPVNHGPGKTPGLKYHAKGHSNSLVPLFARGAGVQRLDSMIVGKDPVRGPYVDNTTLAAIMRAALTGSAR